MPAIEVPASDSFVTIAILVSRVEALCTASMLEANGILVYVSGNHHASVQVNSLVLGGHSLLVPRADYEAASALIREVGADTNWTFSYGLQRAVLRLMAFFAVFLVPFCATAYYQTKEPMILVSTLFSLVSLPVNPQGSGDYFLAPLAAD